MGIQDPTGKLCRWALRLSAYNFDIKYRPGRLLTGPDALSREPNEDEGIDEDIADEFELKLPVLNTTFQNTPTLKEAQQADEFCISTLFKMARGSLDGRGYFIDDDILYKVDDMGRELVVVPEETRPEILNFCHDDPISGGHMSFLKTQIQLK